MGLEGIDNYQVVCQIGEGACGAVFLVRCKENKKLLALKKIELDESRKTRKKEAVLREARILSDLKHPHIVSFHESFFDDDEKHLCIIQDYCDGGTLEDKIKEATIEKEFFQEKQIIQWFLQIAMAVRYMHSKKVLHRDLKTSNVFLHKSGTLCKLGDFGIAKTMDTTIDVASTCVGTPCYLSPEMCQDIPYSSKADVWALGCMLYEMCALRPAFDANNLISLFYKIVKADFEPISAIYSNKLHDLVNNILVKKPEERPSARGVLAVPYLKEELLKFIEEKEFLLQQRRVPTRQGSRPYSTPTLSRVAGAPHPSGGQVAQQQVLPSEQKRAISSRPVLVPSQRENSMLPSARGGRRRSHVSTIIEENEEQSLERSMAERSLRLDKTQLQGPLSLTKVKEGLATLEEKKPAASKSEPSFGMKQRDEAKPKTPRSSDEKPPIKSAKLEEKSGKMPHSDHDKSQEQHALLKDRQESEIKRGARDSEEEQRKSDKITKRPQTAREKPQDARVKDEKGSKRPASAKQLVQKQGAKLPSLQDLEKRNMSKTALTPDLQAKTPNALIIIDRQEKLALLPGNSSTLKPLRLPELDLAQSLSIPGKDTSYLNSDINLNHSLNLNTLHKEIKPNSKTNGTVNFIIPSMKKETSDNILGESPRKHKITDPQRIPRNLVQNALLRQMSCPISPPFPEMGVSLLVGTPSKTLPPVMAKSEKTSPKKSKGHFHGRKKKSSANSRQRDDQLPPVSQDSTSLSVPTEHIDYYSDDFEDSSIEEEIPEEFVEKGKDAKMARSYSFTQTLEIPEIPEDLPEFDDDEDANDFDTDVEEIEEEEYLDVVVMGAREAQEEINKRSIEDEVIVDERPRSNTRQMITRHCLDTLGREKYDRICSLCEDNKDAKPELKRLEKTVGRENMKMFYLMNEVLTPRETTK